MRVSTQSLGRATRERSLATRLCRNLLFSQLRGLQFGRLRVHDGGTDTSTFGEGSADLTAEIEVLDPGFYLSTVASGTLGASESYMRGEWTCSDLVALIRIMARNWSLLQNVDSRLVRVRDVLSRVGHALRRNTRRGSRNNITAHYDLGNDFFSLYLDESMMYSCALFDREESSLEEASRNKLEQICRKLQLEPSHHVMEIGSGWGGFALHAARNFGCRVTTTTISSRQYDWVQEKVREEGLQERIRVVKRDYRDLRGQFDRLVSIEMIEAVGHHYFDTYFKSCCSLLKPDGAMLLQAITVPDQRYEMSRRHVDFIKRYIFPGSCLPSFSTILESLRRVTDFRVSHLDDLTPHYARTLHEWRRRFLSNQASIRALGFSEEFLRMWEYYFSYCEGGFAERVIGDYQVLLARPFFRGELPVRHTDLRSQPSS